MTHSVIFASNLNQWIWGIKAFFLSNIFLRSDKQKERKYHKREFHLKWEYLKKNVQMNNSNNIHNQWIVHLLTIVSNRFNSRTEFINSIRSLIYFIITQVLIIICLFFFWLKTINNPLNFKTKNFEKNWDNFSI